MKELILKEIKYNYKSLIFWSLGFICLIIVGFAEYEMLKNSIDDMASVVNMMPRIVRIMLGMVLPIETPEGYFSCMFIFICLGSFLHAALLGTNAVSREERDKTSEFLFSKPIKRSRIITSKLIVAKISIVLIGTVIWLTTFAIFGKNLSSQLVETINLCMIGMIICQLLFLFIGFFISSILKDNNKPSFYITILIFVTYFISILIQVVGDINYLRFLTPFLYFDTVNIMKNGLSTMFIIISILISILSLVLGYKLWNKRDLRN